MAATSARFWVSSLVATSPALDHSSSQSRPRTIESVVATVVGPVRRTAASSPGPDRQRRADGAKNGKIWRSSSRLGDVGQGARQP